MQRTRIKICGIRTSDAARAASEAGADAIGFVFAKASPRAIDTVTARRIASELPLGLATVGLTVDASRAELQRLRAESGVRTAQLHGSETPESCAGIPGPMIKAIRFDSKTIESELCLWQDVRGVTGLLIDGSSGGLGESFDWSRFPYLANSSRLPLVLAGGLTPENVGEAIGVARPYAVDVSSGVESSRGVKSDDLIREFCLAVQEADAGIRERHGSDFSF